MGRRRVVNSMILLWKSECAGGGQDNPLEDGPTALGLYTSRPVPLRGTPMIRLLQWS